MALVCQYGIIFHTIPILLPYYSAQSEASMDQYGISMKKQHGISMGWVWKQYGIEVVWDQYGISLPTNLILFRYYFNTIFILLRTIGSKFLNSIEIVWQQYGISMSSSFTQLRKSMGWVWKQYGNDVVWDQYGIIFHTISILLPYYFHTTTHNPTIRSKFFNSMELV